MRYFVTNEAHRLPKHEDYILVNNSGIQQDSPFLEMSLEQWQKVIDVNLTGQFLCAREAAREAVRLHRAG